MDVLRCGVVKSGIRRICNRLILNTRKFLVSLFFPVKFPKESDVGENAPWCDGLRNVVRRTTEHAAHKKSAPSDAG